MTKNYYEVIFPHGNFFELTMYQYGYQLCKANFNFGPWVRQHFLFHYVISGKGVLHSTDSEGNTKSYNLCAGQGFMIWPGQTNEYRADSTDPWEYAWVEFDGIIAKDLVMQTGLTFDDPAYMYIDEETHAKMKNALMHIIANKAAPIVELIGYLYVFLSSLIESSNKQTLETDRNLQNMHIQKAIGFIEEKYSSDITVQDIADFCTVHRTYLYRIFKDVLGSTPQQFLISYRVRKAGELLKLSSHSISEIATMVGYLSPLNFSRAFKRETGITPQKYRKN